MIRKPVGGVERRQRVGQEALEVGRRVQDVDRGRVLIVSNYALKSIRPLLDGAVIPKVTHLGLCNASFQDEIAEAIPGAKVTMQLKTLDLSKGTMSDSGGRALIDGVKALSHLEKLDVSDNFLSKDIVKRLAAAFGDRINVSSQEPLDEEGVPMVKHHGMTLCNEIGLRHAYFADE